MRSLLHLPVAAFVLVAFNVSAATLYVSLESTNPVPPYATWATAANVIQDAVDAAKAGDMVLVTNGVYAVGSREVSVLDANQEPPQLVSIGPSRVVITNAIRLESVNGPLMTTVDGGRVLDEYDIPAEGARCVFLGGNALLNGFTLRNGAASFRLANYSRRAAAGAGAYCEPAAVVTNCVIADNYAYNNKSTGEVGRGGGAFGGTLQNCTLSGNVAIGHSWSGGEDASFRGEGGGAYGCTLYSCLLTDNYANRRGGGAAVCILYRCTLTENSAMHRGGGVWGSTLYNCTLTGNSSGYGGGAAGSTLYNCTVTDNSADESGGGTGGGNLYNCTLSGNSLGSDGTFYNCTVTGNDGGISGTAFNSIVYANTNANYGEGTALNHCLTTPLPTDGIGNIDADPRFVNAAAGDFHLRPDSPCIDAGTNLSSLIQTDIEGQYRPQDGNKDGVAAFDIGAYEFRPSPMTLHVSLESTNPAPPYATWETAANVIQDAVDAAKDGDTVLVTNGVYAVGERNTSVLATNQQPPQLVSIGASRVVVTNTIRLESVNGPLVTTIRGLQVLNSEGTPTNGVRCVYMEGNAVLSGFTLTDGFAGSGGGVVCQTRAIVTNCLVKGNSVIGGNGGGAHGGSYYDCEFTGNVSRGYLPEGIVGWGGQHAAVADASLYNCLLTYNVARPAGRYTIQPSTHLNCAIMGNSGNSYGTFYSCTIIDNQGVISGTAFNSIIYGNTNGNYDGPATVLNFCLTTPLPRNGIGNIDADPRFVNAAAGDFHLRPDSPCIDAGTNLSSLIQTDIEGQFRPLDGNKDGVAAFDIGAYEFRPSSLTLHVSLESTNPVPPYATWATAANVIQDAVDAAKAGDTVLVTNGVYGVMTASNGRPLSDAVVIITNSIRLESVNGPPATTICGESLSVVDPEDVSLTNYFSVSCVRLLTNALLAGFTLTNGYLGGVVCSDRAVLTNCVITGVHPYWAEVAVMGGSLYSCTIIGSDLGGVGLARLYNCSLIGNGYGAYKSFVYNCTLTGNGTAADASALYSCTVVGNNTGLQDSSAFNSIIYYNGKNVNYFNPIHGESVNYCCTTPLPTNGVGNITGPPLFMDKVDGDFRLREDSPCIDAGTNLLGLTFWYDSYLEGNTAEVCITDPTDILGNTRFIDGNGDGTVAWDIGAYEFYSFLPPRFSVAPQRTAEGWILNITGAPSKWAQLQQSTDLENWHNIGSPVYMGEAGIGQITDTDTGPAAMFYRVVVQQ